MSTRHDIVRHYPTVVEQARALGAVVFDADTAELMDGANAVVDYVLPNDSLAEIEDAVAHFYRAGCREGEDADVDVLDAAQVIVNEVEALLKRAGKRTERSA